MVRNIQRFSKAMAISRRVGTELREHLCRVSLEIDVDGLLQLMGHRAMGNKTKSSRMIGGLIKGAIQVGKEMPKDGKNDESTAGSRDETKSGV